MGPGLVCACPTLVIYSNFLNGKISMSMFNNKDVIIQVLILSVISAF